MSSSFVEVHRTTDPVDADLTEELLSANGLNVRRLGTQNAALVGVAPHILAQRLEVPSAQADLARELIRQVRASGSGEESSAGLPEEQPTCGWFRRAAIYSVGLWVYAIAGFLGMFAWLLGAKLGAHLQIPPQPWLASLGAWGKVASPLLGLAFGVANGGRVRGNAVAGLFTLLFTVGVFAAAARFR